MLNYPARHRRNSVSQTRPIAAEALEGRCLLSTSINNGQIITGTIPSSGGVADYAFQAPAGATFEISLGDATSQSAAVKFAPFLQVLDPQNNLVVNTSSAGSTSTSVSGEYTVPAGAAGTYTVVVRDDNSTQSGGTYALEMVMAPGTPALNNNGDGGPIQSGQTKTGTISRFGDIDAYTFAASAGNTFELSLGDTSPASSNSKFAPFLQVIDPKGNLVVSSSSTGATGTSVNGQYVVPAGATGMYTVFVQDDNKSEQGGTYALELINAPGALAADSNGDGGAIGSGQARIGTINRFGDLDAYTFSASSGDALSVKLADVSTGAIKYAPFLQVIDPHGNRVISTSSGGTTGTSVTGNYKVPSTGAGTYTVIVQDDNNNESGGQYSLNLTGAHPVPMITLTPPAAQSASAGVAKSFVLGSFTVSGTTGPYHVIINWGDGSATTILTASGAETIPAQSHTYAAPGKDNASITVSDAKGVYAKTTFVVSVSGATATGSISGEVFNDANGNGQLDLSEYGLGLWQVYIDVNKDGQFDSGDMEKTTDINGNFSFTGLAAGTYQLRIIQLSNGVTTTPGGALQTVVVPAGQAVTGRVFGEKRIS